MGDEFLPSVIETGWVSFSMGLTCVGNLSDKKFDAWVNMHVTRLRVRYEVCKNPSMCDLPIPPPPTNTHTHTLFYFIYFYQLHILLFGRFLLDLDLDLCGTERVHFMIHNVPKASCDT